MVYRIHIIHVGYSRPIEGGIAANCSCTVIKGKFNIIIDTMTPWDRDKIMLGLNSVGLTPDDINYVVSTHGHSDHTGNNNLFLKATHIVGYCISFKDTYFDEPFSKGGEYKIDGDDLKIIPTPGHTLSDVTVLVKANTGVVAVTGDLFERQEDIEDENIWLDAGSESPEEQRKNRKMVLNLADFIVPGHGPMFPVGRSSTIQLD